MPDVPGARVKHEHVITGQVQVQLANQAVSESFDQVKQGIDVFSASAVVAANQALELAGKVRGLATDVTEAAQAGAAAIDLGKNFQALGDTAPGIDALRASVAGVVDDTTLQGYAILNAEMELSAETATGFASRITILAEEQGRLAEVSDLLARAQRSPLEVFKELGVVIDANSSQYAGLSEAQRNLMVIQEQSRKATQAQVDALDSASVAVLQQRASWDNLVSSVEEGIAAWLQSSGALDAVGEAIEGVQAFLEENAELFESLGRIAMQVADIVGNLLVRAFNVLSTTLDLLLPVVEGVLAGLQAVSEFIALDFGETVEEVFITDIPFATSNMESLNATIENFRDELRLAQEQAAQSALVQEEQVDLVTQAFEVEKQVSDLYKENVGDLGDAGRALVANLGSREAALEFLSQQREVLENASDLIDDQTDKERAFGAVALRNRIEGQEGAISRLAILEEITAQILTQNKLELEAIEAEKAAEKAREERRRKRKAEREEQKRFNEELLAEQATLREAEVQEAFRARLAGAEARNELLAVGSALTDVILQQDAVRLELSEGLWEADVRANENLARKNELLEESAELLAINQAGLTSAGQAVRFLGDTVGGAGSQIGELVDITSEMAAAFKASADASDMFDATITAAKATSAALIEDDATRASFMGIFETAESARDFANLNFIGGAGHAFAASTYFAAAALGGKGGGAAGGRDTGRTAPTPAGFGPSLATEPAETGQQGPGTSIFVQYVSPTTRGELGPMLAMINEMGRSGAGAKIDAELIEGLGG